MFAPSKSPFVDPVVVQSACGVFFARLHAFLGETQQHGEEREEADEDEDNSDSNDWGVLSLCGTPRERRVRFAPQITNAPRVLPNRNRKRQDATRDQCEPQIPRCARKISSARPGELLQVLQILNDRETEADQRNSRTLPRHHCALKAQAGAHPSKMAVRCYPDFEPACARGGAPICHGRCPFFAEGQIRKFEAGRRSAMRAAGPRISRYGTKASSNAMITASPG